MYTLQPGRKAYSQYIEAISEAVGMTSMTVELRAAHVADMLKPPV